MHRLEVTSGEVRRFVAVRVANREDAADISQQSMMLVSANLHNFRGKNLQEFRAWVFTIARRLVIDHYRTKHHHQSMDVAQTGLEDIEKVLQSPPHGRNEQAAEVRERLGQYLVCIARLLSLPEHVAVLLADVYGFTDKESAAQLSLSPPSFKMLLYKARTRLRAVAHGECPFSVTGECPLMLKLSATGTGDRSVARCAGENGEPKLAGSSSSQPKCGRDIAPLLALRRELLNELGLQPRLLPECGFSESNCRPKVGCSLPSVHLSTPVGGELSSPYPRKPPLCKNVG